ncbi:hypothetical protein PV11_09535 [Exophiala sideris]|uniref:Uncharacterized protein n=1 Tax=Exophiala sideris TaxID=1016849 RepID=A0A0D1YA96_9EURO|nr:hypothetical protein PV11_09535 [Exophiala sideris]
MYTLLPTLAAVLLSSDLVSAAPFSNDTTSDVAIQTFGENGISCLHYPQVNSDGTGRIYVQCSNIPTFWEVRAVWKNAELAAMDSTSQSQDSTEWFRDINQVHYSGYKANVKNNLDTTIEWRQSQDGSGFGDCSSQAYAVAGEGEWLYWTVKIDCNWMLPDVKAMATADDLSTEWATADALHQIAYKTECPTGRCWTVPVSGFEALPVPEVSAQDHESRITWDYRYA